MKAEIPVVLIIRAVCIPTSRIRQKNICHEILVR